MKRVHTNTDDLLAEVGPVEGCEDAPRYFPPSNGLYEVKAGFSGLRSDFGNGAMDGRVFQLDGQFAGFRAAKLRARSERLSKYYQTFRLPPAAAAAVCTFVCQRLHEEYPGHFEWRAATCGSGTGESGAGGGGVLACGLTGETLHFGEGMVLEEVEARNGAVTPPYASAFDALSCQIQSDLNITCRREDGSDWLAAIHLCAPNHWAPEQKIGMDFAAVHVPVPGIEPITDRATRWVRAMVTKGPFVRFVWGLAVDTRLNHHPEPPPGVDAAQWRGREFDAENPRLVMRVEREVIWGFPEVEASLFTIRTSFRDGEALRRDPELAGHLTSAIESMTPESLEYKGLARTKDAIVAWLRDGRG